RRPDVMKHANRLTEFALSRSTATLVLAGGLAAFGIYAFHQLPVEAFPDVTDVQVQVITLYAGHAAEEVEKQVTLPVELELNGMPGLTRLRSISLFGLSFVTATFDERTSDYFARQQVSERLQNVVLPPGVQATMGPLYTPIGEIFRYIVRGPGRTPMELRTLEDWTIERHLR